jgi:hypothetical protein
MGGSKTQTSTTEIPQELSPLFQNLGAIGPQLQNIATGPGNFGQFISGIGAQQVPGLAPAETSVINNLLGLQGQLTTPEQAALGQIQNVSALGQQQAPTTNPLEQQAIGLTQGAVGTTSPEQEAISSLQQFTQGNLFESPATQAVLQSLEEQTLPALSQDLALRGLGRSGAAAEAFAHARTQALLPVFMQELQQRQQAAGQLGALGQQQAVRGLAAGQQLGGVAGQQIGREQQNLLQNIATQQGLIGPLAQLGGQQAGRVRSDLANALEAAGIGRQIAGSQSEANRQEQLRQQNLQSQILLGPLGASGFIPAGFGQTIRGSGGGLFGK